MILDAREALIRYKTFAVVGVSQNKEKYGYEVFEILLSAGYKVYPINPKYEVVDDHRCYPSLKDLPEKPEVVVTLVPPLVTERVVETCAQMDIPVVWMPPGSCSDMAVKMCRESGVECVHDVCLVFAVKSLSETGKLQRGGRMELRSLDKLVRFSKKGHTKNVFFERGKIKAQVVGLEAGQAIPPCRMDHDVIFVVIEGEGRIIVDGEDEPLEESTFVFVPKEKQTRSLQALTKMTVLAIQILV